MNCQQIDRYIFDFCEQNLSPELELQIQEHIEKCPMCLNKVELTRLENEVLRENINVPVLDKNFTSNVLNLIQSKSTTVSLNKDPQLSEKNKNLKRFKIPKFFYVPAMAAIIVLCALLIPGLSDMHSDIKLADSTKNTEYDKLNTLTENVQADSESSTSKMSEDLAGSVDSSQQDRAVIVAGTEQSSKNADEQAPSPFQAAAECNDQTLVNEKGFQNPEIAEPSEAISESQSSLCLYPIELPTDYQLLQIISNIEDELTYIFLDTKSEEELVINISPLRTEPFSIATAEKIPEEDSPIYKSMDKMEDSGENTVLKPAALPESASGSVDGRSSVMFSAKGDDSIEKEAFAPGTSDNNSISWDIIVGEQYYRISLNAKLSPEKLAQIAKIIEFKEDNNNE